MAKYGDDVCVCEGGGGGCGVGKVLAGRVTTLKGQFDTTQCSTLSFNTGAREH